MTSSVRKTKATGHNGTSNKEGIHMASKTKHRNRSHKTRKGNMTWWLNHCAMRRQADIIRNLHRIGVQITE